ncbi:uncharacterized protein LOC125285240 [Alosa alosa]|uniref:uncharacterized protein LOC125285240 n=1 Tax=Alosa alosa TaxID=278164 RepID=UPI00201535E9|nr:uncharacterized protein LOC125285240 [Alosa alosa]
MSSNVHNFAYKYWIISNKTNRGRPEQIKNTDSYSRKLMKEEGVEVLQQFDDICMKSEKWASLSFKKTEIDVVRPKFFNHVLYNFLRCENAELPKLEEKYQHIYRSIHIRQIFDHQTNKDETVKPGFPKEKIELSLNLEIDKLKTTHPISYAFAAALFAQFTDAKLNLQSVDKLASIARQYSTQCIEMPCLSDSMKKKICSAVKTLFQQACTHKAVSAMWLMGLFYKLVPRDEKLPIHGSGKLTWMSADKAQRELLNMVQTHHAQLRQHLVFAKTVLSDMFSVETGQCQLLQHLHLTPSELLSGTLDWILKYPIQELKSVIWTVVDVMKNSLSRSDTSEGETMACLSLTIAVIDVFTDKTTINDPSSRALTALKLLNSFSGTLEHLQHNKELNQISKEGIPNVESNIKRSIQEATTHKELQTDFWKQIFGLKLPVPWQENWEKTLCRLFIEKIKKAGPKDQVNYYCNISDIDSVMEECLCQCAVESVKHKAEHLKLIAQSSKYGKPMSEMISITWKNLNGNVIDWEYFLTNPHSLELLQILGLHLKDEQSYERKLTDHAQTLVNKIKNLLRNLPYTGKQDKKSAEELAL